MSTIIDTVEYLPVSAAAERLATTEMKVLMLLKRKVLTGGLIDGSWLVTTDSLAAYQPPAVGTADGLACRSSCGSASCACR
jgi:hypothetical protein